MNSFVSKQILTSQTIGEQFQKAREGAGYSIRDVSLKIRIKEHYLNAIEIGLYSELPGDIYALEFIKKYAMFLRMDPKKSVQSYIKEKNDNPFISFKLSAHGEAYYFINKIKWISRGIFVFVIMCVFSYLFFIGQDFFSKPVLKITIPEKYVETNSRNITIQGKAEKTKNLFINSEPIIVSESGDFMESYDLPKGTTVFRITAKGILGKTVESFSVVVVK